MIASNGIGHFVETLYMCSVSCQRSLPLHSRRPRVALLLSIGALCIKALLRVVCDPQSRESIYPKLRWILHSRIHRFRHSERETRAD